MDIKLKDGQWLVVSGQVATDQACCCPPPPECETDEDCPEGECCVDGACGPCPCDPPCDPDACEECVGGVCESTCDYYCEDCVDGECVGCPEGEICCGAPYNGCVTPEMCCGAVDCVFYSDDGETWTQLVDCNDFDGLDCSCEEPSDPPQDVGYFDYTPCTPNPLP